MRRAIRLATVLMLFLPGIARASTVYHCSMTGSDTNTGRTWPKAVRTVQHAVNLASPGDQVWVEAGTYFENVTLKDGVSLYGGFAGTETALSGSHGRPALTFPQTSQPTMQVTVLDGSGNSSLPVILLGTHLAATTAISTIDRFTIQNGGQNARSVLYGGIEGDNNLANITDNYITNCNAWNCSGIYLNASRGTSGSALFLASISGNSIVSNGWGDILATAGPQVALNIESNYLLANVSFGIQTYANGSKSSVFVNKNQVIGDPGTSIQSGPGLYGETNIYGNTITCSASVSPFGGLTVYPGVGAFVTLQNNSVSNCTHSPCYVGPDDNTGTNNTVWINLNTFTANGDTIYLNGDGGAGSGDFVACTRNTIMGDVAPYSGGGGVYVLNQGEPLIADNLMVGNTAAATGGAIYSVDSNPTIVNNTVVGNTAPDAAISIATADGEVEIANNIVTGSAGGVNVDGFSTVNCVNNFLAGNFNGSGNSNPTNISPLDPTNQIVGTPGFVMPSGATPNFRLLPGSSCVDAGHPLLDSNTQFLDWDIANDAREHLIGGTEYIDIGCYELESCHTTLSLTPATGTVAYMGMYDLTATPMSGGTAIAGPSGASIDIYSRPSNLSTYSLLESIAPSNPATFAAPADWLPGKYDLKAEFPTYAPYAASNSSVVTLTVTALSATIATTTPVSSSPGQSVTLTGTFAPVSYLGPTPNLVFTVGTWSATVPINSSGSATATYNVPIGQFRGNVSFKVSLAAGSGYKASAVSGKIKVQ